MAIKILITLEGSEQVKAALDDLSKSGEQFMAGFKDLGTEKTPLQDLSVNLAQATPAIEHATSATHEFRDALHILHPILRAAGLEVQGFAGFSRVASAGLAGLATAITGAIIVGLASLEEQAKRTRGALEDLFGSRTIGGQAFANIELAAHTLSTSVENLAPAFESLTTAWQRFVQTTQQFKFVAPPGIDLPPALAGNVNNLTAAFTNFIKILRAGRLDQAAAEKAAQSLFDTLKNGGQLTADALKQLPVGTIQLLAEAMGRGTISAEQFIAEVGLAPIPMNKLLDAMQRFGPQAQQAFQAKAIFGFRDAINDSLLALQDSFKNLTGISFSGALANFFKALSKDIKTTSADIAAILNLIRRFEAATSAPFFRGGTAVTTSLISALPESLKANFKEVPSAAQQSMDQTKSIFEKSLQEIFADIQNSPLSRAVQSTLDSLPAGVQRAILDVARIVVDLYNQIVDAGKEALPRIIAAFESFPQALLDIWTTVVTDAQAAWSQIAQIFSAPFDLSAWQSAFQSAFSAATNLAQSTYDQIASIFANPITVNFMSGAVAPGAAPFASGGLVRGPGTSTSDSILALLSNREFVISAKAVSYYGADLLAALNSLRLPRNVFEGFNMGGMVEAITRGIPRFADGGQVPAPAVQMAPVTIVLGSQKFGLAGNVDTIKALSRFAVNSRLSSGGRKPSWVGSK